MRQEREEAWAEGHSAGLKEGELLAWKRAEPPD